MINPPLHIVDVILVRKMDLDTLTFTYILALFQFDGLFQHVSEIMIYINDQEKIS